MKKIALVLTAILIFWLISSVLALAGSEGIIKEKRNILSRFGIQNVNIVMMLDFISNLKDQSAETYVECAACQILMEEEKLLISQSQKLLSEMEKLTEDPKKKGVLGAKEKEKIEKEIESKMKEVSQKIVKISLIHLKVLDFVNEKFEFLLEESEKIKATPV